MLFVPWRYIADWKCTACGVCCKAYVVVLTFPEWLTIVKNYGVEKTVSGLDKLYLKKNSDGSCVFLHRLSNMHLCGLQHMKPKACKLWPFKVLGKPKFGYAREAEYCYGESKFYVYADSACNGLQFGTPTWEFANQTLKEFVEIALGKRGQQLKTTADMGFLQPYASFFGVRRF
ncbi:MAG: YkgJ family cysteine cluster protein [Candidatus Bathyarchaeia archaeon]